MIEDPIVAEVRKHRLARAAKFNFDIDAIAADAMKRQRKSGHKVVSPPKRRWAARHGKAKTSAARP